MMLFFQICMKSNKIIHLLRAVSLSVLASCFVGIAAPLNAAKGDAPAKPSRLVTPAELSPEQLEAYKKDRARGIRLPEKMRLSHAAHIEADPDAEYLHASDAAHEAFRDIKFGVRIHWGIYTVKGWARASWAYLDLPNARKKEYNELYKTFNPTEFNADEWMELFTRSGIRCVAITSKHHEGFSLYHTQTRVKKRLNFDDPKKITIEDCDLAYSVEETPFKRDIIKETVEAARKYNLMIDLYYSNPDFYDADFRPYAGHPGKNIPRTQEDTDRLIARHREQLRELLTRYGKIDMICLDIDGMKDLWPQLRETMKVLRKIQPDVMFRNRGIANYGDYYTPEATVPKDKQTTNMPWMVIYPLASSWAYDKNSRNYKGTHWIIWNLVDSVSKGGSFMVGIGPDTTGRFHPKAIQQLEETGQWLKTNGKAIYDTRPREIAYKEGLFRFTRTKDGTREYAFTKKWPGPTFELATLQPKPGTPAYLLGHDEPLHWEATPAGGVKVTLPAQFKDSKNRPGKHVWTFEFTVK